MSLHFAYGLALLKKGSGEVRDVLILSVLFHCCVKIRCVQALAGCDEVDIDFRSPDNRFDEML